jgi:AmiR/NasT family two-component response regulator
MAERGITEDEAFDLLRALSQRSNTKLREVARRIVQERTAP